MLEKIRSSAGGGSGGSSDPDSSAKKDAKKDGKKKGSKKGAEVEDVLPFDPIQLSIARGYMNYHLIVTKEENKIFEIASSMVVPLVNRAEEESGMSGVRGGGSSSGGSSVPKHGLRMELAEMFSGMEKYDDSFTQIQKAVENGYSNVKEMKKSIVFRKTAQSVGAKVWDKMMEMMVSKGMIGQIRFRFYNTLCVSVCTGNEAQQD